MNSWKFIAAKVSYEGKWLDFKEFKRDFWWRKEGVWLEFTGIFIGVEE